MLSNPIFIIGTERSGSNLLRLILNSHSRIVIPHPPHLMRDMAPLVPLYGNLELDSNFQSLARDVSRLVNMHFAPWPFRVEATELAGRAQSRSLYGLYAALYDLYAAHANKPRWGCKSTFMHRHIEDVIGSHSAPCFLHLVRDPRDVAASAGESIFSHFHPYKEAELWSEEQTAIESWAPRLGPRKILRVRYEDLTQGAEKEVRRIMDFLNEPFEEGQMQFFRTPEADGLAQLSDSWKNVRQPISNKSVGRFRQRLSTEEIRLIESQTWDLMLKYGYKTENAARPRAPGRGRRFTIESFEKWKKVETETRAFWSDRNFALRWKRWAFLKYLNGARRIVHG